MLTELKEKQKEYIIMQKELLALTKQKSHELHDAISKRLEEVFEPGMFGLMVALSGGILAEGWVPVIGFDRIGRLEFYDFYYSSKDELVELYPDVIDWQLLFATCRTLENEFGIEVHVSKWKEAAI